MHAVIYRQTSLDHAGESLSLFPGTNGRDSDDPDTAAVPGMISIAGAPLLVRQLQWLHSIGICDIAVELGESRADDELADVLRNDVFGRQAHVIRASQALGPRVLATKSGMGLPVLAIPTDTIGDGDSSALFDSACGSGCVFTLSAPSVGENEPLVDATIAIIAESGGPIPMRQGVGWGTRIRNFEEARILGRAVLLGRLPERDDTRRWPIIVHAQQRHPGVWVARGATIDTNAHLEPPVLIGRDAVVARGAQIGPDTFIGDRAVIAAGARVRSCFVTPGALVGEGVELEYVVVYPDRVHELAHPSRARAITDSRLLARRDAIADPSVVRRVFTIVLLLTLIAAVALLAMGYTSL